MAAETVEAAKLEMKALELQMEPLNEQKAKLVAQLKQACLKNTLRPSRSIHLHVTRPNQL